MVSRSVFNIQEVMISIDVCEPFQQIGYIMDVMISIVLGCASSVSP